MRSRVLFSVVLAALAAPPPALAGVPQLRVSPGPLARPHASLEGVGNCGRCHESAQRPSGTRCLECHRPIAQRIAARRGVHRDVNGDCGHCHREHGGEDADLRRIDRQTFNHAVETGFALEGQHARAASSCAACHKKRSFLGLRPACDSCHADPHKTTLGRDCTTCHSTAVPFKQTRRQFDHARARFLLTGAHREVACEKCHVGGVFRGLRFDACSACHQTPHRRPIGPTCTSCHVTDRWATRSLDHAKTAFPLTGAHAQVACARCHVAGIRQALHYDRCSACHADPHRGSVRDDCGKCHAPSSFRTATFDHRAAAKFALDGQHAKLPCRKCHTRIDAEDVPVARKVVDFGGLRAACAACHKDQHKGEYGLACDACHRATTFKAAGFAHPRSPEFFAGRHAGVACVKCHVRPAERTPPVAAVSTSASPPPMTCGTCHADAHLGQLGTACDRCHDTGAVKFAATRFEHQAAQFALAGRHRALACARCHPSETGTFPAGNGSARRFKPLSGDCVSCHKDPHLGQVPPRCGGCHTADTFRVTSYEHRGLDNVFGVARHDRLPCKSCHKTETGQFPAGRGTAMRLKVGRTCLECHP